MKRFGRLWKRGVSEHVTIKDPEMVSNNQWGVEETEIATGIECVIFRGLVEGETESPGLDENDDSYTMFVNPADNRIKAKQNIHRATGQILHVVSPPEVKDKFQMIVCKNLHDPYGQGV